MGTLWGTDYFFLSFSTYLELIEEVREFTDLEKEAQRFKDLNLDPSVFEGSKPGRPKKAQTDEIVSSES